MGLGDNFEHDDIDGSLLRVVMREVDCIIIDNPVDNVDSLKSDDNNVLYEPLYLPGQRASKKPQNHHSLDHLRLGNFDG